MSTATAPPIPATRDAVAEPYRWRWIVLAVVLLAEIMDLMDSMVTTVAAPTIRNDLGGGASTIQWLGAGYTLAFAVLLVTGGRLGDIYGRKRLFLIGAAGFTLASGLCALSSTPELLIGARVLQGAFGALLIPQGLGTLRSVFPPAEMPKAFSLFGPIMGLSAVIGPILAGTLIDLDLLGSGWRMIFLINLPIGLAALLGALYFIPRDRPSGGLRLDLGGMAILTLSAVALVYPLVQGRELGWPLWSFGLMAAGLAGFACFARYERGRRSPLIEPSLLRNRSYTSGIGFALAFFCAMTGLVLVVSLFVQGALQFSAMRAGLTLAPVSIGIAIAAATTYPLIVSRGRQVIQGGLIVTVLGLAGVALTVDHWGLGTTVWELVPSLLVTGLGLGAVFAPLFDVILLGVADHEVGSASGVLTAVQQLAAALGVAVVGTTFFSLLDDGDPVRAMTRTVLVAIAIFVVSFAASFMLPRRAREHTLG